jgi:7-cyano-7-deazaguanine reductase
MACMINHITPEHSELGKQSHYESHYNPDLLFPISRRLKREEIGVGSALPFFGFDVWNHYEVSWLNEKGKPIVAIAELIYGCDSTYIIESKSMKLYFNSFNNTSFKTIEAVHDTIIRDLGPRLQGSYLSVRLTPLQDIKDDVLVARLSGIYLDEQDITCGVFHHDPRLLTTEDEVVEETLYTDLLKSNCLVTNQPDWCSVQIQYKGKKINREGLLRYFVSFRDDNEFHEQCIEKIFMHIKQQCNPEALRVYGRSTRRGGLDINAIRSTTPIDPKVIPNVRLCRQ